MAVGITPALRAALARLVLAISALAKPSRERVSIWSIPEAQAKLFFPLVTLFWSITLGYFAYQEANAPAVGMPLNTPDRVEIVMDRFGRMVVPIAAFSMMVATTAVVVIRTTDALRRQIMTWSEKLYQRLAAPIEARSEARGEARGKVIGEAHGIKRMHEWLQRKAEAEAKGMPFTEPPPEAPSPD